MAIEPSEVAATVTGPAEHVSTVSPPATGADARRHEVTAVHALIAAMTAAGIHDADHSERVVKLAGKVAVELGVPPRTVHDARVVASLHDIGKLGIPRSLLENAEPLTRVERNQLCQHPLIGAHILSALGELARLASAIEAAHERWDGQGYPNGLRGDDIPIPSRIAFVCEAYAAMIEERPYRPALEPESALEVIERNAGMQFCPRAAGALVSVLRREDVRSVSGAPIEQVGKALAKQSRGRAKLDRRELRGGPKVPWFVWVALAAVGLAVGLLIALPIPDVTAQCPPPNEGQMSCFLDKAWLPAIETVGFVTVGFLVLGLAITGLPRLYRTWRRGELRFRVKLVPEESDDPLLVAASWGLVMRDAKAKARDDCESE